MLFRSSSSEQGGAPDLGSRRPEPEVVVVPMDDTQEQVYGWMGLNPTLLLDQPPASENLVVRVVRPGMDPSAVLDEARQQLAAGAGRRRRRGRGGGEGRFSGQEGATESTPAAHDEVHEFAVVPVSPLSHGDSPTPVATLPEPLLVAVPVTAAPVSIAEDEAEPELALAAADGGAEPRRRRRRSSATL